MIRNEVRMLHSQSVRIIDVLNRTGEFLFGIATTHESEEVKKVARSLVEEIELELDQQLWTKRRKK